MLRQFFFSLLAALAYVAPVYAQPAAAGQMAMASFPAQRVAFASARPFVPRPAADTLAASMRQEVGAALVQDDSRLTEPALLAARAMLQMQGVAIDTPQTLLVVDRSPRVQRLWVVAAYPDVQSWDVLGQVRVSTGKPGRKEHFRTPVGAFVNSTAVLGYRAQGTYNENHILGNGARGMRVWDFGWQTTDDWRTHGALMAVRLEMHATDPTVLEPRLGRVDSEGCIRIPAKFNSFLDQYGLIDAQLQAAAKTERRFAALLLKNATPTPLAGQLVVVIDTSDPAALPSDPAIAKAMQSTPPRPTPVLTVAPLDPTGSLPDHSG